MKNLFNGKLIMNFVKNTFHKVESTMSVDNITVIFTEDSKCFPVNEIEIVPISVAENCLRNLSESDIESLILDLDGKPYIFD
jgi:hypothetical protein